MSTSIPPPFQREGLINEPGLAGARWWHDQLALQKDPIARRALLSKVAVGAGFLVAGGVGLHLLFRDPEEVRPADALAAQKQFGWSFGSETEPLSFGPARGGSFDPAALRRLAADLAPAQARLQPLYVPTLFQSLSAEPSATPAAPIVPLASVLRPYDTPEMKVAHLRGRALASLFEGAPKGRAVLVDLPGPEAVAFAAGLADQLEPVFLFDNWPHPRGVVPAHLTLAAAATQAAALRRSAARRSPDAPPAFVMDRSRLNPYTDESDRFDNRYMAKTPPVAFLKSLSITQIVYVLPTAAETEGDDLVDDFVLYASSGVDLKTVAATDFRRDVGAGAVTDLPAETASLTYLYGGDSETHYAFWHLYGWGTPFRPFRLPRNVSRGYAYRPARRPTIFSSGAGPSRIKTRPVGFGMVGTVVRGSKSGVVGARFGRSGSYGRSSRTGG